MADIVTQIQPGDWSVAATWDIGVPGIGDTVLAIGGYTLTVDDDTLAIDSFVLATGSTLTIDATKTLETTGSVTLSSDSTGGTGTISCGGDFDIGTSHTFTGNVSIEMTGTGSITDDSASPGGANLEINTAGTVTLGSDVYCVDFTRSGEIVPAGFTIYASGDVDGDLGTGSPLVTMTGSGTTATWNTLKENAIAVFGVTGSTTLTSTVNCKKLIGDGAISGSTIKLERPVDNFWLFTGTCASSVYIESTVNRSTGGSLCLANKPLSVVLSNSITLTADGRINTGTGSVYIFGVTGVHTAKLALDGFGLIAGLVRLGHTSVDRSGVIDFGSGMSSIASIIDGSAANLNNVAILGPGSHIEFSGLGDFANIAVTASTDLPPEIVCGPGGKVTNCEPDNPVALFGDADVNDTPGTNNANITSFVNNQAYPGSLMTLGIGGGRLIVPFLLISSMVTGILW